ncbi:MAG: hypothetical protein JWP30_1899 [Homoserinimonas sp.]|jgi:capsular polysaccharide biosynthesis protein|nr:hypothetical protein [Homoserinimonas sp.]
MTPAPETDPIGLDHYAGVLRFHLRTIAACALLGLGAGTVYLAVVGQTFTASTDVNINVISTDPFNAQRSASGLLDGVTEAKIASSHVVALAAADELRGDFSAEKLRQGTEVNVVSDATIIRISYSANTIEEARSGADALSSAYVSYRATQAGERLGGVIDRIEDRLSDLREELTDANARAAGSRSGSTESNQAASDRDLITIEIDSLLSQKNALELIDTSGGSLLSTAAENEVTAEPRPLVALVGGSLAGVALGILVAFLLYAVRRRVASVTDLERLTGTRVLANVTSKDATVPAHGETLNELRAARERIYASLDANSTVIVMFDDSLGVDGSDIPVNLAAAFAHDGQSIHLLAPGMSDKLQALVCRNLSLELLATSPAGSSYHSTGSPPFQLHIPDVTETDSEPDGLITSFIYDRVAEADPEALILLALPPHAPHSSRIAAGRLADALCMVVAIGHSRTTDIEAILDEPPLRETAFLGAIAVPRGRRLVAERFTSARESSLSAPVPQVQRMVEEPDHDDAGEQHLAAESSATAGRTSGR